MAEGSKKSRRSRRPPRRLPKDVALLHGPTEDGEGARLLRLREGTLFAGEVRPVREGQDVADRELVRLKPLSGRGPLCEVETLHAPRSREAPKREGGGPARVSSASYRKNWSAVFGGTKRQRPDWSVN